MTIFATAKRTKLRLLLGSAVLLLPSMSIAQQTSTAMTSEEANALRDEIQALRQEVAQMKAEAAKAKEQAAKAPVAAPAAAPAPTAAATTTTWSGAPQTEDKAAGFIFKPRGRMQIDVAGVNAPNGIAAKTSLGIATEFRRLYLGFDGSLPGGFGYRIEADLANSSVDLTDAYLTYKASPKLTLTLGQHKPFQSMEDMTSDLFTSFMERAAFNSAFGFERRIGLSGTYAGKDVLVQAGIFADNAADLNLDSNNSYSLDGRLVFMPKIGKGQLHLGGSAHFRTFNDVSTTARYRARPFVHTTDLRLVNTGNFSATGENAYGLEAAYINGRLHATAENQWMTARRPGALADPTFTGGYAELGYFLTDDVSAYKNGAYDRIKPKNPVEKGGIGAVQANVRFDWLDLNDGVVIGGQQDIAAASLLWLPTNYVRFILNYGHIWLKDAAVPAGALKKYEADSVGVRAQFDF